MLRSAAAELDELGAKILQSVTKPIHAGVVRHSDDPDSGDYYRALRGSHRSLAQHLGAAE